MVLFSPLVLETTASQECPAKTYNVDGHKRCLLCNMSLIASVYPTPSVLHLFITLESACGKTCWSQKGFHVCDNNFSIWLIFCVSTLFNTSLKSAMDPISTVPLTGLKVILAAHGLAEQWSYETLRQFSIAKSKIELEIYSP